MMLTCWSSVLFIELFNKLKGSFVVPSGDKHEFTHNQIMCFKFKHVLYNLVNLCRIRLDTLGNWSTHVVILMNFNFFLYSPSFLFEKRFSDQQVKIMRDRSWYIYQAKPLLDSPYYDTYSCLETVYCFLFFYAKSWGN